MEAAERPRSDLMPIALIVFLGLVARAWLAWSTPLIGTDGALFVWNAELWDAEGWRAAVRFPKHPLYPFLIWLLGGVVGGYERAGLAISAVLGALQVVPVFLLARRLGGRGAAIAAGVLLAIHPFSCRHAGDVMTEGTYYFLFLLAVWFGYLAGADRRWGLALLAGAIAGLAYLTRPEGAVLAAMIGFWILVSGLREWRGVVLRGTLLTLAFAAVILPYLLANRSVTGQWLLTKKGATIDWQSNSVPGAEIASTQPREPSRLEKRIAKYGRAVAYADHLWREVPTVFKLYLLPLALAFLFRGWRDRRLHTCLSVACVAWLAFLVAVLQRLGYLSGRYLLTIALLAMPWVGLASRAALEWVVRRFPARGRAAAAVLVLTFLAGTLSETLKPQRRDQQGTKLAGEWIRAHGGAGGTAVLAVDEKLAYYSGGRLLWWPELPYATLREKALPLVAFVAATEEDARKQTADFPIAGATGELDRVWESPPFVDKGPVVVWKVVRER